MQSDLPNLPKICLFATGFIGSVLCPAVVKAQIVPDRTLEEESSVVIPQQLRDLIEGGAVRGENLFHSFSEFSIPEGQQVYFANPDNITNILTRITGNNISEIFGTLGVDGGANLFLLNPNGIVFGENASLDVAGSFLATTAESLIFDDGEFSAVDSNAPPLLTVNFTPGLQYGIDAGEIDNQGVLEVENGQNLSLLGQKVIHSGSLIAPSGLIKISGTDIDFAGTVDTSSPDGSVGTFQISDKPNGQGVSPDRRLATTGDASASRASQRNNILIREGEAISGESISQALANSNVVLQADKDITVDDDITSQTNNNLTFQTGRSFNIPDNRILSLAGGSINIEAGNQIDLATDSAIITGNPAGDGGDISLNASGDITTGFLVSGFINNPGVALVVGDFVPINTLPGTDNAGDINVNSSNGAIASTNFVLANALGEGGNITFEAVGNLTFTAPEEVSRLGNVSSVGMLPGELTLTSGETLLADDVRILNRIGGDGETKDITLTGKSILVEGSSIITLTRDETQSELGEVQNARGGDVIVQANEVVVRNGNISTRGDFGTADAGDLTLNTGRLTIIKDAELAEFFDNFSGVSTTAGDNTSGDGGDLTINASESIELIGDRPGVFVPNSPEEILFLGGALISTSTQESGTSGDLTIDTPRLVVRDRATVNTFPFTGEGGDLTLDATEIFLQGKASISTGTLGQDAGDLNITSDRITIVDGGNIGTATFGIGDAGNFDLVVDELSIGSNSSIGTNTFSAGDGGRLNVESNSIEIIGTSADSLIANGINATSLSTGDAGSINIQSDRL